MESPPKISTKSVLPPRAPSKSWLQHLTLDTLVKVLIRTVFNPFLAFVLVLCLRAQVTPTTHPAWIIAVGYLIFLSVVYVARVMNHRIAYGIPRMVDSEREVGASVAVLDIKVFAEGELEATLGEDVEYFRCDVGNRQELEAVKETIEEKLGTPTVIINCAAARVNGLPLLELPADAAEKTLRTNLLAPFHLYQVFLPKIISDVDNGGTIVTISSVLGQTTPAGLSDYSASKAGLSALHRTLEAELRENDRIKMLLVEVGQMATPLFDWIKTPNRFLAPNLEPVEVAREIVATVLARYLSGVDRAVSSGLQTREPPSTPENGGRVLRSSKRRKDLRAEGERQRQVSSPSHI
ncbi:hypothetical protein N7470_009772 [Penicillium chermesinum]|nr:hypothetical protein N7470_009772 [Penicillium chermesinum]